MDKKTFAITLGNCSEQDMISGKYLEGFTYSNFIEWKDKFEDKGAECELIKLNNKDIPIDVPEAYVLIIKNGVNIMFGDYKGADKLFEEQNKLEKDTKTCMYGRLVNKLSRHNLAFDETAQEAVFEKMRWSRVAFKDVPLTDEIHKNLPIFTGPETFNLQMEANYYYDINKCGIGFHGDAERRKVVCIRLGASLPLHFQWHYNGKPIGERIELLLNHGDIYFMSEKATGYDWKKKKIYTLRHSAGRKKYLKIK